MQKETSNIIIAIVSTAFIIIGSVALATWTIKSDISDNSVAIAANSVAIAANAATIDKILTLHIAGHSHISQNDTARGDSKK